MKFRIQVEDYPTWKKICIFILSIIIRTFILITFGVLLWIFQELGERNDYCDNDVLKKWAKATSIMLFIYSGISIISVVDDIFLRSPLESKGKLYYLTTPLQVLLGIGIFTTCIGLTVNNSSDCGQFYKLVLAYFIIYYSLLGIALLTAIYFAISFIRLSG